MDTVQIFEDTLMSTQYIPMDREEPINSWAAYRQLYYYEKDNRMVDEWGNIVHDIYKIITPNDLMMFKKKKEYMFVRGVQGEYVELIYPSFPNEYYVFDQKNR